MKIKTVKRTKRGYLLPFLIIIIILTSIFSLSFFLSRLKNLRIGFGILSGDCNSDNQVNILDFQLLSNSFGKSEGQTGYNTNCDFNNDSSINILDFQILSNNFGRTENTPSPTPPLPTFSPFNVPAFPGAEGFGAAAKGGRGGKVFEVTNLNDSGTGSLRECVAATGARICVFKVGGLITLNSSLTITNPNITIAGQTAPGGGITLKKSSGGDVFSIKTSEVIIRYVSVRPGPGGENHGAQIASNNQALSNIIIDHSTFSWGVDSNIETWYRVVNATIQWSIISEALDCSTHSKGCHSKGIMIGGYKAGEGSSQKGSENISVHHNLIAHVGERAPLIQMCGIGQVINNITYNPYWTFAHQQDNCIVSSNNTVNWIGNFHKKGPDSTSNTDLKVLSADSGSYSGSAKIYIKGNIGPSRLNDTLPESNWVDSGSRSRMVDTPASAPPITTTDAQTAYTNVLDEAGNSKGINCLGNWYSRRDSIDSRVVNEVKNGSGRIIDSPTQVGGWITPSSGTPCQDNDHDGMADEWETTNGLNPNINDSNSDKNGNGYTNIEEFLNGSRT